MNEKTITIYIHDLEILDKSKSFLARVGLMRLNDLLNSDIERNDIKGCLHKVVYHNKLIYAVVLYDAVAGGAGHVRRLVTEDGLRFRQVVDKAIAITKGCNCSPSCYSCLRNYYNQKIHDLLNRKYAYDFLENFSGDLEPITNEEFESAEEPCMA